MHQKVLMEYSKVQDAFHRTTPQGRALADRQARERGQEPTYDIVGEFDSWEAAGAFFNQARQSLTERGYFLTQRGERVSPLPQKLTRL